MLVLYAITGILKLLALLVAPMLVAGLVGAFTRARPVPKTVTALLAAWFAILEVALLADKHKPFLIGNVYDMVSLDPHLSIQVTIGAIGDAAWFWWCRTRAIRLAERIRRRGEQPDPADANAGRPAGKKRRAKRP